MEQRCVTVTNPRAVASTVAVDAVPAFDILDDFEESPQRAVELVVAEVGRLATDPDRFGSTAQGPDFPYRRSANCPGDA